jgi:hypothetical protein
MNTSTTFQNHLDQVLAAKSSGIVQQILNMLAPEDVFAADMKEMMNNWDELTRRAIEAFPNDTDEERFQRVSKAMAQSITGA